MTPHTLQTVLVGVDLPDEAHSDADPVLATAVALAHEAGARLHVVHAVESGPLEPPLPPSLSAEMETAAAALDQYLDAALPGGGERVTRSVRLGRAHHVLAEEASKVGADLVVVGPHRGGDLGAQLLGTTADRMLRTLDVPCWIARGPLALPLRHLTAAVDFSPVSARALDVALRLARTLGNAGQGAAPPDLEALFVEWPVTLEDEPDLVENEIRPRLRQEVDEARARTSLGSAATVHTAVEPAVDPSRGILRRADENGTQLIVLGTHGRGWVARALIGDVASIVSRRARTHVVLVPPAPGTDGH